MIKFNNNFVHMYSVVITNKFLDTTKRGSIFFNQNYNYVNIKISIDLSSPMSIILKCINSS